MKKLFCITTMLSLLVVPLFAAPTDEEVVDTFTGVFTIFGTIIFTEMTGMEVDGAAIEMDMATGVSTATFENLDVDELFTMFGGVLPMSGNVPEIPFSRISGTLALDAEQDLVLDASFRGGPVKTMQVETKGEDVLRLTADGRNYSHIGKDEMIIDNEG